MKIKRIVEVFILLLILTACTDNLYVKSGMYTPDLTIDTSDAINTGEDATFNLSSISSRKDGEINIFVKLEDTEGVNIGKNKTILKSLDEDEIERLIETLHFLKKNRMLASFLNEPCSNDMAKKAKDTAIFYSAVLKANLESLDEMTSFLIKELGGSNEEIKFFQGFIKGLEDYQENTETRQWTNGDFIFTQTITNLFGGVVDLLNPVCSMVKITGDVVLDDFLNNINSSTSTYRDDIINAIKDAKKAGTLASILVDNLAFVDSVGSITDGNLGLPTIGDIIGSLI